MIKHIPKLSIIIPSYNQALLLQDTLESISRQGYPKLELIIESDSSDHSLPLVQAYDCQVKHWEDWSASGRIAAINQAKT